MIAAEFAGPYTLAVAVVLLAALVIVLRSGRAFSARFRDVEAKVDSIDKQVNQVEPGEQSLRQVVAIMHGHVSKLRGDVTHIRVSCAAAAEHAAHARKLSEQAAEQAHKNNVLLTEHIAACEGQRRGDA